MEERKFDPDVDKQYVVNENTNNEETMNEENKMNEDENEVSSILLEQEFKE